MIEYAAGKLKEADFVLIGLGEELDLLYEIRNGKKYQDISRQMGNSWMLPFAEKILIQDNEKEKVEIYNALAGILKDKNYFVVSLCQDDVIYGSDISAERTVEPCGGYRKLQCSQKCSVDLYEVPENVLAQVKTFLGGEKKEENQSGPVCPRCGESLVFNNISAENYMEDGYLGQWNIYKKWLQGTVNRKLCILEIGVGMKYPTVIRWPFEKIVFFNQKAELFRVHSRLSQISGEIRARGHGISGKPEEFIMELCNYY